MAQLINLPESGMGYQLIEAKKAGEGLFKKFVVYNSELIVDNDSTFVQFKSQIIKEGFANSYAKSDVIQLTEIKLTKVTGVVPFVFNEALSVQFNRVKSGKGADQNPVQFGTGSERFVRLSAYQNDRRIDIKNAKLLPGAYATTLKDYNNCKQFKDNPVNRYALPNDEAIKWAFHIQPLKTDPFKFGIAQPKFDRPGGGEEALFESGTSNKTLLATTTY